ncbi:hypothetical protein CRG98_017610 [Punica granatum]|uniref:Uncharacterized protein n=1 Tax=Punica granatum TaxID=22663 RepID=A0A2I0K083_PUNGR|nr:hypothetical protein CRG98_017610 [Punica granatum]
MPDGISEVPAEADGAFRNRSHACAMRGVICRGLSGSRVVFPLLGPSLGLGLRPATWAKRASVGEKMPLRVSDRTCSRRNETYKGRQSHSVDETMTRKKNLCKDVSGICYW